MKRSIVDPHFHLWDSRPGVYPWLDGPPYEMSPAGDIAPIAKRYFIEDYLAEAASYNVRKTVHVEAGRHDSLEETVWVANQTKQRGVPNGIVAGANLCDPGFGRQLERQLGCAQLRGVRQILNWDPDPLLTFADRPDYMADSRWLAGFGLLSKHGLSFDLQVYPWQLPEAAKLAARFPNTLLVLNHAGMPLHQTGIGLQSWRNGMHALAARENTAVKLSGLGMMNWNWTIGSIRPYILETIEIFGIERCMFASNFPVDRLYSSFDELYAAYEIIVGDFNEPEKIRLFESNAETFYRI